MSSNRALLKLSNLFSSTLPYECRKCGERYAIEHHTCPACGGYRVERSVWTME